MSAPPPLEVSGLVTSFDGVVAVDQVDLTLAAGELVALVGPSGCGKSTLLRTIAGLVAADAGTICLAGELVEDGTHRRPPEGRSIGLVFQDHALFPHLQVGDNVGFGVRGLTKAATTARVDEMLDLVGLGAHRRRFPHELSGGERQRVALARALAPSPALMLLDEPFASLDHNLRVQLRHDVVGALAATGCAAVFVTHDQREALSIGDRIAVMRRGRVVQLDAPATVFHRPVDAFVGAFMGEASFLAVGTDGSAAGTELGPVDLGDVAGAGATAMVRPDDVTFVSAGRGDVEVVAAEYRGSEWLVTVRSDAGSVVRVASSHLLTPSVGERGHLELVSGHRQVVVAAAPR